MTTQLQYSYSLTDTVLSSKATSIPSTHVNPPPAKSANWNNLTDKNLEEHDLLS